MGIVFDEQLETIFHHDGRFRLVGISHQTFFSSCWFPPDFFIKIIFCVCCSHFYFFCIYIMLAIALLLLLLFLHYNPVTDNYVFIFFSSFIIKLREMRKNKNNKNIFIFSFIFKKRIIHEFYIMYACHIISIFLTIDFS